MTEATEGGAAAALAVTPPAPPANATEASARLAALAADKDWSDKLLAGDVGATKEFHQLSELVAAGGSDVDMAMAGVTPSGIPDSSFRLMAASVPWLREMGISDGSIRQLLSDQKVSKEEHRLVSDFKARHMRDPEWTKKYLAGDMDARKLMTLCNIVMSVGIADAAAA
jgi:hypothetical protein